MDLSRRAGIAATAATVLLAAAGGLWFWQRGRVTPAALSADKPSVAVLYFENNTGNPQLDWLRTGLTDMLVTDLSQSPDVEVLGTDRLVQILTQMKRQDDRQISFDTVQELAKRAGVQNVILGSYVKAGETIRINLKLQEAATGRIVTAERVESIGESNLFPTVDDLTRRIKAKFALGGDPTKPLLAAPNAAAATTTTLSLDRDLSNVTTSSIEAYRYYVQGIDFHNRARELEALPLLEKAIQVDPTFAMALVKLAVVESNLGHPLKRQEYSKRALEHVDRLTPRERYYIEGYYYSARGETLQKAIDVYRKAIELYPDHAAARHNLALLYSNLGRDEDAIPLFEELRRRRMAFPITYTNLAAVYRGQGQYDKAYEVLQEDLTANPEVPRGYQGLGGLFSVWGRFDEALAAYDKALALEPANLVPLNNKGPIFIVTERWADYAALNRRLLESSDSRWKYQALRNQATEQLYKGRSADAIRLLDTAAASLGPRGSTQSAGARVAIAELMLDRGQPATALVSAKRAVDDAAGIGSIGYFSLETVVRLHGWLGQQAEMAKGEAELTRLRQQLPSEKLQRLAQLGHDAVMAHDRRDPAAAIVELKKAEPMLQPGDSNTEFYYELGTAYLETGKDNNAAEYFDRIITSGTRRAFDPIRFVRSLYFLGQISERKGDRTKATEYYRRFIQYWGDGDIDRDRVKDARKKISGS